jgi:activator of HSP90 ATPase
MRLHAGVFGNCYFWKREFFSGKIQKKTGESIKMKTLLNIVKTAPFKSCETVSFTRGTEGDFPGASCDSCPSA